MNITWSGERRHVKLKQSYSQVTASVLLVIAWIPHFKKGIQFLLCPLRGSTRNSELLGAMIFYGTFASLKATVGQHKDAFPIGQELLNPDHGYSLRNADHSALVLFYFMVLGMSLSTEWQLWGSSYNKTCHMHICI